VVGLTNARPVLVDHALLAAHCHASTADESVAEEWLVRSVAVMSVAQVDQTTPHGPIPHDGVQGRSTRTPRCGRACDVQVDNYPAERDARRADEGVAGLNVKGAGVSSGAVVGSSVHDTGLASLDELLQEHMLQRLVAACFEAQSCAQFTTTPFLAILDAGFDLYRTDGSRTRAALGIRRALTRPVLSDLPPLTSSEQLLAAEAELRLRRKGVTSSNTIFRLGSCGANDVTIGVTGSHRSGNTTIIGVVPDALATEMFGYYGTRWAREYDRINIQYSVPDMANDSGLNLVDFGQYSPVDRFDRPLVSMVRDGPFGIGGTISPSPEAFGHPRLGCVNPALWMRCEATSWPIDPLMRGDDGSVWAATLQARMGAEEVLAGRSSPGDLARRLDAEPMVLSYGR
jgi:hypothetical protein